MTKIKVIGILIYRNTYWLIVVEILLIDNSRAIAYNCFYLGVFKDIYVPEREKQSGSDNRGITQV
jgi:hypothetical protein